jgi:hypothetical protein
MSNSGIKGGINHFTLIFRRRISSKIMPTSQSQCRQTNTPPTALSIRHSSVITLRVRLIVFHEKTLILNGPSTVYNSKKDEELKIRIQFQPFDLLCSNHLLRQRFEFDHPNIPVRLNRQQKTNRLFFQRHDNAQHIFAPHESSHQEAGQ